MARLLRLVAQHWPIEGALAQRLEAWPGDIGPKGASLPLRLASALHALVLNGQSAQLRAAYPPHHTNDDPLIKALRTTLTRHDRFIDNWLTHPPQTNEVARSAGLIPAAMWLQHQYKLPILLSELGASAGLNLGFDRFALNVPGHRFGPDQPVLDLAPDWHGPVPTGLWPHIAERRGVDLNPLDPTKPEDATRLIAYLWPDQPERIARTRAAIAHHSANVDTGDAIDWARAPSRAAARGPPAPDLPHHCLAVFSTRTTSTRSHTLGPSQGTGNKASTTCLAFNRGRRK